MRLPARPRPERLLTIAVALLAALWGAALSGPHLAGRASLVDRLEAPLLDLRFHLAGPRPAPDSVVVVAIDDETTREFGYPLPRAQTARLVDALAALEPKAVALDLLFVEGGPEEQDRLLAEALARTPAVVAAAGLFGREEARHPPSEALDRVPYADRIVWPIERIRASAAVGLVNMSLDIGGTPRHAPLILLGGGEVVPSLPLQAAALAARADPVLEGDRVQVGGRSVRLDQGYHLPLRFYGPRGTVRTVSAGRLLRGEGDLGDLRGRIFIVGATAIGSGDTFASPFDPVLPGVELLATAAGNLVTGDGLIRDRAVRRIDAAVAIGLPVATVLLLGLGRTAAGYALTGALAALWAASAFLAFLNGYWLSAALPLAAALPAAALYGAARLWTERRLTRRLTVSEQAFRQLQPPTLADHLSAHPDFLAEPLQQDAAVLFIDLSGFTGLSERIGPEATRTLLKDFHGCVEAAATQDGGIVGNFMGDGAMILFGVPAAAPDDPCRAVRAAVRLSDAVSAWLATLPRAWQGEVGVRQGAHFGPVVVSRLGAEHHQQITATGDTVNVASRLLETAAQGGAAVAVSESLLRAAGDACSAFDTGRLGAAAEVRIRGRAAGLRVHLWHRVPDAVSRAS